ncbi:VanZ family protein [Roseateles chitinivorans]|uniref:VanZ family protein n=1 Tax=Roseateles chitinivorans TaxID=2917965 RepID=UPI0018ECF2DB|nr:VanZ family protein [Roseateles chitinivorans]
MSEVLHDPRWRSAWRLLFLAVVLGASWLAFSPHPPRVADLGWDKANHFAAFGTLAIVGMQCFAAGPRRRWIVLAMLLAYGVLIELVQSQIPGRDAEARDVLADMIGASIGVALHALLMRVIAPRALPAR